MIKTKVTAILKLALFLLPAATTLSGLGAAIGLSGVSTTLGNDAKEQFMASEQFQEIQQGKIGKLDEQLATGSISQDEYDSVIKYIESEDFASSEMKANVIEDKQIRDLIAKSKEKESLATYMLIPFSVGMLASLWYLSENFRDFVSVRENMQDSYWEIEKKERKKAEKERKKKEREFEKKAREYTEEVLGD